MLTRRGGKSLNIQDLMDAGNWPAIQHSIKLLHFAQLLPSGSIAGAS